MAVQEKVKSIIAEQLGVKPEEVTPEASFIDDLGADSLDTVELIMALEEEFNIEIPDEDAEKMTTVGDAVRYIDEKSGQEVTLHNPAIFVSCTPRYHAGVLFLIRHDKKKSRRHRIRRHLAGRFRC